MLFPEVRARMARQHGLITFTQACVCGMAERDIERMVRMRAWVRMRRGVFTDAEVYDALDAYRGLPLLAIRAAELTLDVDHWYSHDSAALLHGLPVIAPQKSLVHVTRPGVTGGRIQAGINHHGAWFHPHQGGFAEGLPVLDMARTAVDMAREHGLTAGVGACDAALRMGCRRSDLERAVEAMRSWPGVRTSRAAVGYADPGAESMGESGGRVLVHELGIGPPETQFGLTDGHRIAFCDIRVGRHIFEFDGRAKYLPTSDGGLANRPPNDVLWDEKKRQDFVCGFKLGMSRITWFDLFEGRDAARIRLRREYDDTMARFGRSIDDLAPYRVKRHR